MKLIVQPDAGITPIVNAIRTATKTIDILIFRLDVQDVRKALGAAVARGVAVRALIAHTNRGGAKSLRKLEMQLLEAGVTVSRTAEDLIRYHGKMMIVDARVLHLYGFNYTWLDIERSRSFGIVTRNKRLVQEGIKLFEADCARHPYKPSLDRFVVSPENARDRLCALIGSAKKQLLIYDVKVSDPAALRRLAERAKAGVDIRIMGKVGGRPSPLTAERYPGKRLHVRAIICDGRRAFIGSQSLRKLELDRRREVGVVIDDKKVIEGMITVFERDWALTDRAKRQQPESGKGERERPAPHEAAATA